VLFGNIFAKIHRHIRVSYHFSALQQTRDEYADVRD